MVFGIGMLLFIFPSWAARSPKLDIIFIAVLLSLPYPALGATSAVWLCGLQNECLFPDGLVVLVRAWSKECNYYCRTCKTNYR